VRESERERERLLVVGWCINTPVCPCVFLVFVRNGCWMLQPSSSS
jgi:hypothetical protein